jgi:predicted enzyme related to lactoylglutathione lyase
MRAQWVSIPVQDQEQALAFYTGKLGFITKHDIPLGGENRWLTVVSEADPEGTEVVLEPSPRHFEPARTYQEALFAAGIPCTQFRVNDLQVEYDRLVQLGVVFSMQPTDAGAVVIAVLNDTCGNYVQLVQMK